MSGDPLEELLFEQQKSNFFTDGFQHNTTFSTFIPLLNYNAFQDPPVKPGTTHFTYRSCSGDLQITELIQFELVLHLDIWE